MSRKFLTTASALVALGVVFACSSDRSVAPDVASWRSPVGLVRTDRGDPDIDTVVTLRRTAYLADDITESALIGPDGGEIDIDGTGARVVFPPGALSRQTRIAMTVKAGWNVAYEFGPHGISFDAPVAVQQDLSYTVANNVRAASKVQAGYFQRSLDTAFLDQSRSLARVSELRQVFVDRVLNSLVATFYIYHFSGYMMSSGFAGGGTDTGSDSLP
jgi:hypothetical protein